MNTITCAVCGRPPHVIDDPECLPVTKPIAEQLAWALGQIAKLRAAPQAQPEPVHGDVLPPVGSRVFIRHGRDDDAHACTVTGYYAWPDLAGDRSLHRVFVHLVYEGTDREQARMLRDCWPTREAALASTAQPEQAAQAQAEQAPIDMVLHCPKCGHQHIDAREYMLGQQVDKSDHAAWDWNNPPHRSHLCHKCGHIWRPADVPTNGVAAVKTKGKNDHAFPSSPEAGRVGLTEAQKVACLVESGCIGTVKMTYESGPYEITRTTVNADKLIRSVERAHGIPAAKAEG